MFYETRRCTNPFMLHVMFVKMDLKKMLKLLLKMSDILGIFLSLIAVRVISSVGLERCIDIAEVAGSNPVLPTINNETLNIYWGFRCFIWFHIFL